MKITFICCMKNKPWRRSSASLLSLPVFSLRSTPLATSHLLAGGSPFPAAPRHCSAGRILSGPSGARFHGDVGRPTAPWPAPEIPDAGQTGGDGPYDTWFQAFSLHGASPGLGRGWYGNLIVVAKQLALVAGEFVVAVRPILSFCCYEYPVLRVI